jgi:pimeloyl-ACP methyl ester carboxylesterase
MSATLTRPELDAAPNAETLAIRPFRIDVPQQAIDNLRLRLAMTRWPQDETVADSSQGVPLATMQELARDWATDYDWRKVEARLNALPQFITEIDGLDIHFHELDRGGHFAAWEVPGLFSEEIRAAFRSLR